MAPDPVQLRPARPTIDEGLSFARFLDVAADGVFRFLLGRNYDRIIGQAYLSPAHDLSFETVVFTEQGGTIAGMASAYSAGPFWGHSPTVCLPSSTTCRMATTTYKQLRWTRTDGVPVSVRC